MIAGGSGGGRGGADGNLQILGASDMSHLPDILGDDMRFSAHHQLKPVHRSRQRVGQLIGLAGGQHRRLPPVYATGQVEAASFRQPSQIEQVRLLAGERVVAGVLGRGKIIHSRINFLNYGRVTTAIACFIKSKSGTIQFMPVVV